MTEFFDKCGAIFEKIGEFFQSIGAVVEATKDIGEQAVSMLNDLWVVIDRIVSRSAALQTVAAVATAGVLVVIALAVWEAIS